jgi:hypothetical protein
LTKDVLEIILVLRLLRWNEAPISRAFDEEAPLKVGHFDHEILIGIGNLAEGLVERAEQQADRHESLLTVD